MRSDLSDDRAVHFCFYDDDGTRALGRGEQYALGLYWRARDRDCHALHAHRKTLRALGIVQGTMPDSAAWLVHSHPPAVERCRAAPIVPRLGGPIMQLIEGG